MATGALVSLIPKLLGIIPKLGKFLKNEYTLANKVEKEIRELVAELEYMQAFLEEECNKPTDQLDKRVQLRARDIREMSYHIEDQIDTFLVRVEGNQEQARPSRSIKRVISKGLTKLAKIKTRHNIDGEIKHIKAQVKELHEKYKRYSSDNTDKTPLPSVDPRLNAMYKMISELVGIDESMGELIKMLTDGDDDISSKEKLKTVSVVGIGGLGKTTLAKAVYDKLKKVDFESCAFVPVGQNPNVMTVLNRIHYELLEHKCEVEETDVIINALRDFLEDKRYLIVIDDIWDDKHWGIIKNALIENNHGSRVITTTRKFNVASEIGQVYKLKPLSDDNSKKLFCTRIFNCASKFHDYQLDEVPEKILSKCCGVPLAINTMASLLACKPRQEWSAVYSSIGFSNNSDNEDVENTKRILSFSFYDMPSHLRACLLYLGVYPEDKTIEMDDLICKWIAEGIVQDEQGVGLFVLGKRYFFELINRSMIQPTGTWYYPVVECRLHDMVLALIRSLCVEYSFLTILDKEQGTLSENNIVRRLSYQRETMTEQDLESERNMVHMRSFVAHDCQIDMIVKFSRFKVLRILSLKDCKSIGFSLKFVGDLLHLRYLSLRDSEIGELPEELGALKFLQTLDLSGTTFNPYIKELPSWIGLLTRLVCLLARQEAPVDGAIGKLTSLENLVITAPGEESARKKFLKDVGNLTELRQLYIVFNVHDENIPAGLLELASKLSKLIELGILISGEREFCWLEPGELKLSRHLRSLWLEEIKLVSLPKCINSSHIPDLVSLRLRVRSVDVWGMRTLGALPELLHLDLATESDLLVVDGGCGCFRKLLRCRLTTYGTVVFLPDRDGAPTLPSVQHLKLTIRACAVKSFCLGYGQDMSFIKTVVGLRSFTSLQSVFVCVAIDNCIPRTMAEQAVQKALRNAIGDRCSIETYCRELKGITSCNMDTTIDKVIRFCVPVAWFKRLGFDFDYSYSYFGTLRRLEKVIADISCKFATPSEVEEAMEGLKCSVDNHPDRPMLEMILHYQDQQPLDHYVATQGNENDGPATASVVTAAEKEEGKRQVYTPPRVKAPTWATSHNTDMEPYGPFDVFEKQYDDDLDTALRLGFNLTRPTKEVNVDGIDLNFEAPIEDVNVGIDLNFEAPMEDVNDEIYLNLVGTMDLNVEQPIKDANDGINLNFQAPIEDVDEEIYLSLGGMIDLNLEQPIKDANVGIDLNFEAPTEDISELKLAELFTDLVLCDPYANEDDGACALSYTSPVDVQAAGAGFGGYGSSTGVDVNNE